MLVAGAAVGIGILLFKRIRGLPKTRRTVQDDMALLRRGDGAEAAPPAQAR